MLHQITDPFGSFSARVETYFKELVSGYDLTASLVCDENGNTVNREGSSAGIGNQTDLALLIALRRKSQVVLTSGETFRADQYRFPKFADLAVLTRGSIDIAVPVGQHLLILDSSYSRAIGDLISRGYLRVHIEFGLTGIQELVSQSRLDALFLSSTSLQGVHMLAQKLGVTPTIYCLEDLCIGLVAWQPKLSVTSG